MPPLAPWPNRVAAARGAFLWSRRTLPGWVAKRNEPVIIPDASLERRSIFRSSFGPDRCCWSLWHMGTWSSACSSSPRPASAATVRRTNRRSRFSAVRGPGDRQCRQHRARWRASRRLLERQLAGERRLLDVSEQLVSTLEPRRVLEQIADTIGSVVHYDQPDHLPAVTPDGGIEAVLSRAIGRGRRSRRRLASHRRRP